MSSISSQQALHILSGSEGAEDNLVTLAVPDKILGRSLNDEKTGKSNRSGFSFGKVQLDVGGNPYAATAYKQILALGVANGIISQNDADFLEGFIGAKRPDLPGSNYANTYREAKDVLNRTVFDPKSSIAPQVNQIIRAQQAAYLDKDLVPRVNTFLSTHTTGAFDPNSPDYATAVAAVVAVHNRSGEAEKFKGALQDNSDPDISAIKNAYVTQTGLDEKGNAWALVQRGAANYASDRRISEVPYLDQYKQYLAAVGMTPSGPVANGWPSPDAFTPSNGLPSWWNTPTTIFGFPSIRDNDVASPSRSRPVSAPQNESSAAPSGSSPGSWIVDTMGAGSHAFTKGLDYFFNNVLTTPAEGATSASESPVLANGSLSISLNPQNDPFGARSSSVDNIAPRDPNAAAPPPNSDGMIGLFSGKPMQFPFAPIFERRVSSGATSSPSRPSALDDLISSFGRSQTPRIDAGAAAPVGSDRQAFTGSGNGAPAWTASPAAFAPPIPMSPDPQGPLSLNEAYLEYLKRLNAS